MAYQRLLVCWFYPQLREGSVKACNGCPRRFALSVKGGRIGRNEWTDSTGIGGRFPAGMAGRFQPEQVDEFNRNDRSNSSVIRTSLSTGSEADLTHESHENGTRQSEPSETHLITPFGWICYNGIWSIRN